MSGSLSPVKVSRPGPMCTGGSTGIRGAAGIDGAAGTGDTAGAGALEDARPKNTVDIGLKKFIPDIGSLSAKKTLSCEDFAC